MHTETHSVCTFTLTSMLRWPPASRRVPFGQNVTFIQNVTLLCTSHLQQAFVADNSQLTRQLELMVMLELSRSRPVFFRCWGATVNRFLRRNHLRRRSCQSHRTFHFVPHFISCEDKYLNTADCRLLYHIDTKATGRYLRLAHRGFATAFPS